MKLLFMGTPEFAAVHLRALVAAGFDVACAVSQPDKPKNRGMKVVKTPVAEAAQEYNIPLYAPQTLKDNAVLPLLEEVRPELIIVVAYGKMLPDYILNFPKYGCINIHASLLPKYRGAAPIQWSVINGDRVTGVSSMYMVREMDAGDIIMKREIEITKEDTAGTMHDKLAVLGSRLLTDTVEAIKNGAVTPQRQDTSGITYAPMLKKEMGRVDWRRKNVEAVNLIRGLNPWPCAFSEISGKRFKIFKAEACSGERTPGQITDICGGITVAAGSGSVKIHEIQFENKKRMSTEEFLRGNRETFQVGAFLG